MVLLLDFEDRTFDDVSVYEHTVTANGTDVTIVRGGMLGSYSAYLDSSTILNNYLWVKPKQLQGSDTSTTLELDGDFTIEAWVHFVEDSAHDTYSEYQDIIASQHYSCFSGESGSFVLRRVPKGNVEVRIYDFVSSSCSAVVDTPDDAVEGQYLDYGVWHHVAFVRNGTASAQGTDNCFVYVNGSQWLSFSYVSRSPIVPNGSDSVIGC